MNRPLKSILTGLSLVLGFVVTATPAAASFNANFTNADPKVNVTYKLGSSSDTTQAGRMNWTATSGSLPNYLQGLNGKTGQNFMAFCIELTQQVADGVTFTSTALDTLPTSTAANHMGVIASDNLKQFWARWDTPIANLNNATINYSLDTINFSNVSSGLFAAALQIAIWEIVYEAYPDPNVQPSYNTTSGHFYITNTTGSADAARDLAKNLLDATDFINGARANLAGFAVTLVNYARQDQVTEIGSGFVQVGNNIEAVPVPPALALVVAGLLPCVALRRRLLGTNAA